MKSNSRSLIPVLVVLLVIAATLAMTVANAADGGDPADTAAETGVETSIETEEEGPWVPPIPDDAPKFPEGGLLITETFPDPALQEEVRLFDSNGDGYATAEEVKFLTLLDSEIYDFTGVEWLFNVNQIYTDCAETLDVSKTRIFICCGSAAAQRSNLSICQIMSISKCLQYVHPRRPRSISPAA